jgi:hypothetical protein
MADKQINIRLSEEQHLTFKLACIQQGRTMREVLLDLIACFVYDAMFAEQADDQGAGDG